MLEVQKYLRSGKTFEDLTSELGIKCNFHKELPLVILNYDQIESPKMHPIVIECRGLVLNSETFDLVAGCMPRFFNLGEATEITDKFDWNSPINSLSKEDGSLMTLFYFRNKWIVKTRNSWADQPICENGPRWDELFFSLIDMSLLVNDHTNAFCEEIAYVFEMCSMYNQVVRIYPKPTLFLLAIISSLNNKELYWVDESAEEKGIKRPTKIKITDIKEVEVYIRNLEETDGTAEGLVLQDKNGLRIKVKSSTYLAYSRLGNNGNLCMDKHLVPLILANEQDEAIAIFPTIENRIQEVEELINGHFEHLFTIWNMCKNIENQKDFAIFITKTMNTPFNSILFNLKKRGIINSLTVKEFADEFKNHSELIIKVISG